MSPWDLMGVSPRTPNSKIQVSLGRLAHSYEIDLPEGFGYDPDLYLIEKNSEAELEVVINNLVE